MTDLAALIERNDLAGIMRLILALLDDLYPDAPGAAYRQNVNLRGHIQQVYNSQNFIPDGPEPIRIAAIAAACHNFLRDGKSVNTIMLIPAPDLLAAASNLEQKFRAYNRENMPTIESDTHITSNADGESERKGDADLPAPSGRDAGFVEYYRDPPWRWPEQPDDDFQRYEHEIDRRQREIRSLLMEIGGSGSTRIVSFPDGSGGVIECFREAAPLPLAKDPSAHIPVAKMRPLDDLLRMPLDGERMIVVQPRMHGRVPDLNRLFSEWITNALYAMLAFQTIKGWYKPKDAVK